MRTPFVEPGFGARGVLCRRQPDEGEIIAALEVDPGLLEGILPFQVDQRRDGIRKRAVRIELRREPAASTKIAQPEPRRRSTLLSRAVVPTSSAGVALSRSGPRNCAVL